MSPPNDSTRCIGYLLADVRMFIQLTAAESLVFLVKISSGTEILRNVAETPDCFNCTHFASKRVGPFLWWR